MSNEQTVKDVYAGFERGDVAAIVARVADDVDSRNDGVASNECPSNGNFSGKANLPGFFQAVGENLDLPVFEIKAIAASGQYVAVQLRIEGKCQEERPGHGERRGPFLDVRRSREDYLLPALQRHRRGTGRLARMTP